MSTLKVVPKNVIRKLIENAATDQYRVPNNKAAIIVSFTAVNTSGGAATIAVNFLKAGDPAASNNLVKPSTSIAAAAIDRCPELVGKVLNANEVINTTSGTAGAIMVDVAVHEVDLS